MAVRDEIAALRAAGGTRKDEHNLRSRRMAEHLPSVTRPFFLDLPHQGQTRTVRVTVPEFGLAERTLGGELHQWLWCVIEAQWHPGGALIVRAQKNGRKIRGGIADGLDDYTDERNPVLWSAPETEAEDGTEPNPEYSALVTDPSDPRSQPLRTKYREDLTEAFRQMVREQLLKWVPDGNL